MPQRPLILFDIDGTLVVPGDPAHGKALVDAFREITNHDPDLTGISYAGMLDSQITRLFLEQFGITGQEAEAVVERVMERMGMLYAEAVQSQSLAHRLLDGAVEAVEAVRERKWLAGTLSGNARHVAEVKLEASGIYGLTKIGAFGDSAHERWTLVDEAIASASHLEPELPASRVVLIGDTPRDITAAHLSGARSVAVATGRFSRDELLQAGADSALDDLRDSVQFIEAIETVLALEATARPAIETRS